MGKAKPVKKATPSSSKISTTLFQRKSKTSQGAGLINKKEESSKKSGKVKESSSSGAPSPKKGKGNESKSPGKSTKDNKEATKKPTSKQQKAGGIPPAVPVATKKKVDKKPASPPPPPAKTEKKGKVANKASTKKGKITTGKIKKAPAKPAVVVKRKKVAKKVVSSTSTSSSSSVTSSDGERERSTRSSTTSLKKVPGKTRKSRESRDENTPSPTSRLRSPESEKVITRKRVKSDSESPPPLKIAKVGEKGKGKNSTGAPNSRKKVSVQKKAPGKAVTTSTKDVAKKVARKAVASIVASKKKTIVKKVKKSTRMTSSSASSVSSSTTTTTASSSSSSSSTSTRRHKEPPPSQKKVVKKPVRKVAKTVVKPGKVVKVKSKTKPKTKVKAKRMASLNAKAILEASFSFEPSEKKQRSPAPSSSLISTSTSMTGESPKSKSTATSTDESTKALLEVKSSSTATASTSTSTSKGTGISTFSEPKKKDAFVSVSVSTGTSPTPPEIPETASTPKTFKSNPVPVKSEKKRKSTDASSGTSGSRRESTSSAKSSSSKDFQTGSHSHASVGTSTKTSSPPAPVKREKSVGKASSRRSSGVSVANSAATSTSVDASTTINASTSLNAGAGKGSNKDGGKSSNNTSNQKKKQKMVSASTTTSTSTSTSPIPSSWNEQSDVVIEKRVSVGAGIGATITSVPTPKQKKHRSNSSTGTASGGKDKGQDSTKQTHQGQVSQHHHSMSSSSSKHHKSANYQAKEKSSTPVALYGASGTVYQPAGPLIEPHKQCSTSSVPAGILPETVRLPPDLKVTYQTHPPSSAFTTTDSKRDRGEREQHHHHHHSSTKASGGSSSKSQKSSSSKSERSSGIATSAGTILHQPYKSTTSSSSSPSLSRNVPSTYSSTGSGYASSTGTPLLSPSDAMHSQQHHHHHQSSSIGSSIHGSQSGGSSSLSMSAHHHPLHSVTPGGSITIGGGSSQQIPGAPSSSGLFYSATNYGPQHSPFAPTKYPIVPTENYRTQSPFPNSFLCPPSTPQPSQSYFMTPFYTPPLTPNPTPGLGALAANQARALPLSSAAHHPSAAAAAAAAAFYQQQAAVAAGGPASQGPSAVAAAAAAAAAAGLPASYYMASPQHHSIHPPPAPGHAGPSPLPNRSSQPACPCPTDSSRLSSNSTSSSTKQLPLQQRPSLSSGSQVPEAGAKQPKFSSNQRQTTSPALVSVTASRPSRKEASNLQHPPTCRTPAVGADPPQSLQIIPNHTGDAQATRQQLESAKTFTEQYSLPDDITITPILPPPSKINAALLMLNSSVSVILTSAPSSTTTTMTTTTSRSPQSDGLLKSNNSCNTIPIKPKEKDIVHVIDPRSGQKTTIAKHISNSNNRMAGIIDNNKNHQQQQQQQQQSGKRQSANSVGIGNGKTIKESGSPNSRMETVRKLNPDLDVIVISRGDANINDKIENTNIPEKQKQMSRAQIQNHHHQQQNMHMKQMPPLKPGRGSLGQNKIQQVPFSALSSSAMMGMPQGGGAQQQQQLGNRRVALAHNGINNFHRNNKHNNANGGNGSLLRANQKKGRIQNRSAPVSSNKNIFQSTNAYPSSTTTSSSVTAFPANYALPNLPPGISISAGIGGNDLQPTDLSKKTYNNNVIDFQPVQNHIYQQQQGNYGKQQPTKKAIKRSLNECIDGLQLQQKKMRMIEQQHQQQQQQKKGGGGRVNVFANGTSPPASSARTAVYNVNGGKQVYVGMGNLGGAGRGRGVNVSPQQIRNQQQQLFAPNHHGKSRLSLPAQFPASYNRETTTAARVRDPDYELKLGGMLINQSDAVTAVGALVVEPFDFSMGNRQRINHQYIHHNSVNANGLSRTGIGRGGKAATARHSTMGSYAFTEAKKKVNKMKQRQQQHEKVSAGRGGGRGAKSKILTRLSAKPKGLHNSQQPLGSRSRSRLLRKRSLLCNPNSAPGVSGNNNGSRRSESDSSICASRSNSSVRILPGAQNGTRQGGKDKEKPRNTQAFIDATADLYQYRRSVILRVPSPKPLLMVASADGEVTAITNLNRVVSADQIARFGSVSPVPSTSTASGPFIMSGPTDFSNGKGAEVPRESAAHQMAQLARNHIMMANQPVVSHSPQAQQESKGPAGSLPRTGSMVVNALKKRAGMKPLSPASVSGALNQQLLLNSRRQPRWSNGWRFEGEPYEAMVYVKNDDAPTMRLCYPSMRHDGGDIIRTRDCVLLKSGPRKNDLPFIAKIAALWENPADGEMMFSLLWYYRPEHTELGRTKDDMLDEIFASKHRDTNSVATIEDRCYVLTFNEYCRYRKRLKQLEEGLIPDSTLVPFADSAMINTNAAAKIAEAVWNGISQDPNKNMTLGKVSPEVVFFCRKVYDFRQKRILKNPS